MRVMFVVRPLPLRRQLRRFSKEYTLSTEVVPNESELTPSSIVEWLNQYIIGQADAKREVAVAVRERWRRLQLPDEKAVEITPKNMLVSGPSGCGKTEIIRRVSKLLHAPFVKVDASTFTRRGVVGANVTDMIVELYDRAEAERVRWFEDLVKEEARTIALDILAYTVGQVFAAAVAKKAQPAQGASQGGPQQPIDFMRNLGVPGLVLGGVMVDDDAGDEALVPTLEALIERKAGEVHSMPEAERELFLREKLERLVDDRNTTRLRLPLPARPEVQPGALPNTVKVVLQKKTQQPHGVLRLGAPPPETPLVSLHDHLDTLTSVVKGVLSRDHFDAAGASLRKLVEQNGIVFIDEIDKVVSAKKSDHGSDRWMNTDVQQELLTLVEGTSVNVDTARAMQSQGQVSLVMSDDKKEKTIIDTTHILFVCAGAFTLCKPSDMLVELLGRLPVRVKINSLTEDDLHRVLTETKYPMIQQQTDLFATEGVQLAWEPEAVREVAAVAYRLNNETENTGARVLASVLRTVLSDVSFRATEFRGKKLTITREMVIDKTKRMSPPQTLSNYVL